MQTTLFERGGESEGAGGRVQSVPLHFAARARYLNYALSVITSRALPDVRDGLKPVQRRILYAMHHDLGLRADSRCLKCARVVGEVMGKYHPHGDQSIYDALVRMAQDFSLRYPLVDGQGNFGSVDGDRAAAMRYTEARLRPIAGELLAELKQETVESTPTYDGQLTEPAVLPAQVPNLLVNGATGIAVGMATNIPPHNLREVVDAAISLIDDPDTSADALAAFVRGPDFPTGGEILNEPEELRDIYATGQGTVRLRGGYTTEVVQRRRCIVLTSVPYGVNKAALVEKIGELVAGRKVPQLVDVRDESTDTVRVVLELKRGADADAAMAYLFKHTPLQTNFHVNLTCLVPGEAGAPAVPARLPLKDLLRYFLDFRLEVVTRRLRHRLARLRERIHLLEGLELLFDALDEALALIRASKDKRDAAGRLMERLGLDEVQADYVLGLPLYRLARLEVDAVRTELAEKRAEAAEVEALLADEAARWAVVRGELLDVARAYGDARRTVLAGPEVAPEFEPEAYIVRERTWVIVSRNGRVKRQGGFSELSAIRVPEGDEVGWALHTDTLQTATFFTTHGRAYVLRVSDLPATSGFGDPLQATLHFSDGERVVGVTCSDERLLPPPAAVELEALAEDDPRPPFAIALTRKGKAVRFPLASHREVSTRSGRRYLSLADADEVLAVAVCAGDENVALATAQGRVLLFSVREVPPRGGVARGVNAIRLGAGDRVLGFALVTRKRDGLAVATTRGRELLVRETSYKPASRGGRGTVVIRQGGLVLREPPPPQVLEPREPVEEEEEPDDDVEEAAVAEPEPEAPPPQPRPRRKRAAGQRMLFGDEEGGE